LFYIMSAKKEKEPSREERKRGEREKESIKG
jgi:hypothetical protein